MHILGPTSVLLSTVLMSGPKPAPTPPAKTATAPTEVELELVERGRTAAAGFTFVVPVDGSVTAWIERGDDARRCEVEIDTVQQGLRLELDCGGDPAHAIKVEAIRALQPGVRTKLAEVKRPGGPDRRVFVTLR